MIRALRSQPPGALRGAHRSPVSPQIRAPGRRRGGRPGTAGSRASGWLVLAFTLVVGGCAGAHVGYPSRSAGTRSTLPPLLSDAEFWRLFSSFSEEGGAFTTDNFTSNEMAVSDIAAALSRRQIRGGVYIGVGPEQNFTYLSAIRPEMAFIVDIRRQAAMQHLMYKALFEISASRGEFIARLFSREFSTVGGDTASINSIWERVVTVRGDSVLFERNLHDVLRQLTGVRGFPLNRGDSASLEYVYEAFFRLGPYISYHGFSRPEETSPAVPHFRSLTSVGDSAGVVRSFLASETNYSAVRELHQRNLIVPVVGDFGGRHALQAVAAYLWEHHATVSAFYTSNVEQYLFRPNNTWHEFYANAQSFPTDVRSLFIRPRLGGTTLALGAASVIIAGATPSGATALIGTHRGGDDALCGMQRFFVEYNAGRVQSYQDALSCPGRPDTRRSPSPSR